MCLFDVTYRGTGTIIIYINSLQNILCSAWACKTICRLTKWLTNMIPWYLGTYYPSRVCPMRVIDASMSLAIQILDSPFLQSGIATAANGWTIEGICQRCREWGQSHYKYALHSYGIVIHEWICKSAHQTNPCGLCPGLREKIAD